MSFESKEISLSNARPMRLYKFTRGVLKWTYTNVDRDITYAGDVYESIAISDNGVRQTGQTTADALEIIAPNTLAIVPMFRVIAPSAEIELAIYSKHTNDSEVRIIWVGSVSNINRIGVNSCKVTCESLAASFARPGLRMTYQVSCPHSLYDRRCTVDKAAFSVSATITAINNSTISSTAFSAATADYFTVGYIEWDIGLGELEQRAIELHSGAVCTIFGGTNGLSLDQTVTAYAGCLRTKDACINKFNNFDNYGGIPGLPGKSPFDGNPFV